ncbi:MAG: ABC-2 type transport system ATP-binding protein [Verrucomicrobia bacterium]|jgi:ABC-2 type transport system ATP-binding protein|nr:MAG: ABC-2 type transport system ATP-binding protein [Verrucomicrobiota bacterium]
MIEIKNLSKHFGPKVAVDGVSFEVKKGEVLGFLGPNGAGKSTTMRMITGFIPPTAGTVQVGGFDIVENELQAKAKMGYLPESAPLYNDMSVHGFLSFAAEIRGMDGLQRDKAVDRVIELCFLQGVRHQSIDTLSKGYRHRTCLAQALIHDPEVLVMDEPTDGLDPNQKHEVRNLIRRMGEEKAIVFSTHILEEVEAACSRAIIIDRGRIIANGTPAELRSRAESAGSVILTVRGKDVRGVRDEIVKLPETRGAKVLEQIDGLLTLQVDPRKNKEPLSPVLFDFCVKRDLRIEQLTVEKGHLDEVFRSLTTSDIAA